MIARRLSQAGAKLALCARDEAKLQRAHAELTQKNPGQTSNILALTCDVTDRTQVESLVQQVRAHFGAIDILINNAGTDIIGPVESLTLEDYDLTMQLHFWAPLYTMYAVLPEMQQRGTGRIVNISSIGGKVVSPHMVAYCASKHALVGLSEGMQTELSRSGIFVTTVCPGPIRTGVIDHVIVKGQHRKEFAWFSIADSLPVMSASAEQVARLSIAALRRGDTEVLTPFSTWLTVKFYGLFPGLTVALLGLTNRFLPKPGDIGTHRALGRDSHSAWSSSGLTTLSDRAAQQNNELPVVEPQTPESVHPVSIAADTVANRSSADAGLPSDSLGENGDRSSSIPSPVSSQISFPISEGDIAAEQTIPADPQSAFPLVDLAKVPPAIQACLTDIQDTLGIPWKPANWRAYALYPAVMQLFWERLKPACQTESFLRDAIAITEEVYRDLQDWYEPSYQMEIDPGARRLIERELNAFSFGNPQLLIQQVALSRTLAGQVVGQSGHGEKRHGATSYRRPEIQLIGEQAVQNISPEMQLVYREIRQTLDVPFVNSDYEALVRWPAFFLAAWEDIRQCRELPDYQLLKDTVLLPRQ